MMLSDVARRFRKTPDSPKPFASGAAFTNGKGNLLLPSNRRA
jgi:hypothetical protein